jgi:hypothetical protein
MPAISSRYPARLSITHMLCTSQTLHLEPCHARLLPRQTPGRSRQRSNSPGGSFSWLIEPVHSNRFIEPVHSNRLIEPVHSNRVIEPVHSNRLIEPVHSKDYREHVLTGIGPVSFICIGNGHVIHCYLTEVSLCLKPLSLTEVSLRFETFHSRHLSRWAALFGMPRVKLSDPRPASDSVQLRTGPLGPVCSIHNPERESRGKGNPRISGDDGDPYRGILLTRNHNPLGTYSRTMSRALLWSQGVGVFL